MPAFVIPAVEEKRFDQIVLRSIEFILPWQNEKGTLRASYCLVNSEGQTTKGADFYIIDRDLKKLIDENANYATMLDTIKAYLAPYAEAKANETFVS